MATLPFWYPLPHQFDDITYDAFTNVWDEVFLNGVILPGIAKVKVKKGRKLDVKEPPGSHGATITDRGYKPADVDIELTFWTPLQWTAMQGLFSQTAGTSGPANGAGVNLEPAPTAKYAAPAYSIDHPATALHGVQSVILEEIEGPEPSSSMHGAMVIKLKCRQFFPPPELNATNTPTGTIAPQPNALTPTDPATSVPAPS